MRKIDNYTPNETWGYLASRVIDEDMEFGQYGGAVTDAEWEYRKNLEKELTNEIELAKLMLVNNPEFANLSYEKQIKIAAYLLEELAKKSEKNKNGKNSKAK